MPSETTTADEVFTPFMMMAFFTVVLLMAIVPVEPKRITFGEVTDVLVIVRSRLLVALLDPSMITLLLFILIKALLAKDPVSVVPAAAGLMVKVYGPAQL